MAISETADIMYKHLFGPVPSRRLGVSLGIDLTPGKACSYNCVYCECGKTEDLTTECKEYVPTHEVLEELDRFLAGHPELDSITFSGSGEPTLHSGIGKIIGHLKQRYPNYRVTVLTNSSTLHDPEVQNNLLEADVVVPSIDAVTERAFRIINRPKKTIKSTDVVEGIVEFSQRFEGEPWIEVFIVPGINDSEPELSALKAVLDRIKYTKLQLNTLDRPGALSNLAAATSHQLQNIAMYLGGDVEIISRQQKRHAMPGYTKDVREHILRTIRVRPCTSQDLESTIKVDPEQLQLMLNALIEEGVLTITTEAAGQFYTLREN